jgi:hypothetical protein
MKKFRLKLDSFLKKCMKECQNNADLVPSYKYPTHPTVLSLKPVWLRVKTLIALLRLLGAPRSR